MDNLISRAQSDVKLILRWVLNIAGNGAIVGLLPSILPSWLTAIVFFAFNIAMITESYMDPTYTVHLIQTGAMAAPSAPSNGTE